MKTMICLLWMVLLTSHAQAACEILDSAGRPAARQGDALFAILSAPASCPLDARAFRATLVGAGLGTHTAMVANRGRWNPTLGSFSFFESVTGTLAGTPVQVREGELFFGHFTGLDGHRVVLDQTPDRGKLMMEFLAWDPRKGYFNFYELIGTGTSAQWFYRGDSRDILRDNRFVYREPPPGTPKFGTTLRCAGCHSSGGPILKELSLPHNDWWSAARPLGFAPQAPDPEVGALIARLEDAETFASRVRQGMLKLERSPAYQRARSAMSLQEQLRPLFCENEINLESDPLPGATTAAPVRVPSAFVVNPLLASVSVSMDRATYRRFMQRAGLRFPETSLADADHAWLTPVKGASDLLAIRTLVSRQVVDAEFVSDVLAVDFESPVFSSARCALLRHVPEARPGWKEELVQRLRADPAPGARELLANLTDPARTRENHLIRVRDYAAGLNRPEKQAALFQKLLAVRSAAFRSEISLNPRGQILEPGFRVIFPVPGAGNR